MLTYALGLSIVLSVVMSVRAMYFAYDTNVKAFALGATFDDAAHRISGHLDRIDVALNGNRGLFEPRTGGGSVEATNQAIQIASTQFGIGPKVRIWEIHSGSLVSPAGLLPIANDLVVSSDAARASLRAMYQTVVVVLLTASLAALLGLTRFLLHAASRASRLEAEIETRVAARLEEERLHGQ